MIRQFFMVLLISLPISLYAQNVERWVESNNSKQVFISPEQDSTQVSSSTKIASNIKERLVVHEHELYKMLYNRKAKQTNWLLYNDTIATVEAVSSGKNRLITFADGSVFKLEKENRHEWVISQEENPLLRIKKERENGKIAYLLFPQDEHEKLDALRPLALTYLVESREMRERQTTSILLAVMAGFLRSLTY